MFDEKTFYQAFIKDFQRAKSEIIIESPFVTTARVEFFMPTFVKLLERNVKIYIITRCLEDIDVSSTPNRGRVF